MFQNLAVETAQIRKTRLTPRRMRNLEIALGYTLRTSNYTTNPYSENVYGNSYLEFNRRVKAN